jgi:hypothetical protein
MELGNSILYWDIIISAKGRTFMVLPSFEPRHCQFGPVGPMQSLCSLYKLQVQ